MKNKGITKKAAVLLSGGVDSSVACLLAKKEGHDVTAFYIKIWLDEDFKNCPWKEDIFFASSVAKKLNIPLKVVSLQKEYYKEIISYAFNSLKKGKTPNPDMFCNREIKFGLFEKIYGKDFDIIVTGHYAQKEEKNNKIFLKKSKDLSKDQSYFLALLNQKQLKKASFPIGNLLKTEVRQIAQKNGLITYKRPDSQGLCFIGKIKYSQFISHHFGKKKGKIIDFETKKIIGQHYGYWLFTTGQRHGLNIGGSKKPYYTIKTDPKKNIVYAVKDRNNSLLNSKFAKIINCNLIAPELYNKDIVYVAKVRHPHPGSKVKIIKLTKKETVIEFLKNEFALTKGQFIVLYKEDFVIGAGEITKSWN